MTPPPNHGGDNCSWCFLDRRHLVLQEKPRAAYRSSNICTQWLQKNRYLVISRLAIVQYILQYNHWQQISSTTNILKHNTEMYHCGEKTELVGLNTTGHYRTKYRRTAQDTAWQPQDSTGHYTGQPDENNRRASIDKTNKAKESVGLVSSPWMVIVLMTSNTNTVTWGRG